MKYIITGLLLFTFFSGKAQKKYSYDYKLAISFNPFALAQVDNTLLPGIEWKLRQNLSIAGEAGYIFASSSLGAADGTSASGFIIRPGIRFYVNEKNNFYLQPQFFYKQVTHRLEGWVGRNCVDGVPAYEEFTDYKMRRSAYGVNIVGGKVVSVFSGSGLLDFYFGIGIRYRNRKFMGEDNSCLNEPINRFMFFDGEGVLPSLPLGMRLCFIIK